MERWLRSCHFEMKPRSGWELKSIQKVSLEPAAKVCTLYFWFLGTDIDSNDQFWVYSKDMCLVLLITVYLIISLLRIEIFFPPIFKLDVTFLASILKLWTFIENHGSLLQTQQLTNRLFRYIFLVWPSSFQL